jgi:hypothetical protein
MLALLAGGLALAAAEDQAHAVKLKDVQKGDVAVILIKQDYITRPFQAIEPKNLVEPKEEAPKIAEEPKPVVKGTEPKPRSAREVSVFLFEETVLAGETNKRPTRLQRRYEQAIVKKDGKETTLPYEWKTVVIEKKDDKYRYLSDGKELSGDSARVLEDEFTRGVSEWEENERLLPKKPVRVNETWTIATEPFNKELEEAKTKIDAGKSTAKGKLLNVYEKDGRRFGVFEARLEFSLLNLGQQNAMPLLYEVTLDICIDGSSSEFLRTEKYRMGDAKQPSVSEGTRQVLRREVRKK